MLFPCGFRWVVLWAALGVSFGFWGLALCGLVGWLWLFLCILPVYLGAPYAFILIKLSLLIKKKKKKTMGSVVMFLVSF